MRQSITIRTKQQVPKHKEVPVVYYGDNENDPIITLRFTEEKKTTWLYRLLTGNKYTYTIAITDE